MLQGWRLELKIQWRRFICGEILLKIFRLANWLWAMHVPLLPRALYIFNRIVFSVVLPPSVTLGRDALFSYSGLATVIHARCKIGHRVVISQGVTIGGRAGIYEVPKIGNDVMIGAGAKILGPVVIGDKVKIGANSVVISDIPSGATVAGVPAKIIRRSDT